MDQQRADFYKIGDEERNMTFIMPGQMLAEFNGKPYGELKWESKSMLQTVTCSCCHDSVMERATKGLRHHCRKCGSLVCGNCVDDNLMEHLDERIEVDGIYRRAHSANPTISPLAYVCKKCHIRGKLHFTGKVEGSVSDQMGSTSQNAKGSLNQHARTNQDSRKGPDWVDEENDEIKDHKCMVCGIGVPASIVDVFDWKKMLLRPMRKIRKQNGRFSDAGGKPTSGLFCKRCMYTQPDSRGGIKLHSVFVSRLPLSVKAEDVHATFEDHFGFVHHVAIPKDTNGKPKTDADGFAFGHVFFYRQGGARTIQAAEKVFAHGLDNTTRRKLHLSNEIQTGQRAALHAGWCWTGDGNGRRCRIHHVLQDSENDEHNSSSDNDGEVKATAVGPIAIRSHTQLSADNSVRMLSALSKRKPQRNANWETTDKGLSRAAKATRNLLTREAKQSQKNWENDIRSGILFSQMFSTLNLRPAEAARQCAMHDNVAGLKRLMMLNDHSVKSDSKRRRGLFDPYSERYELGRTLLHIVSVHGSTGVLTYLLSDKMQASVMTTRAKQQRAAREHQRELKHEFNRESRLTGLKLEEEDAIVSEEPTQQGDADEVAAEGDVIEIACNALDDSHCTPLHLACIEGTVQNIQLLIDRGSRTTSAGLNGMWPLHMCAAAGHLDACRLILNNLPSGAWLARNADGLNAVDLAEMEHHDEVAELIRYWVSTHNEDAT